MIDLYKPQQGRDTPTPALCSPEGLSGTAAAEEASCERLLSSGALLGDYRMQWALSSKMVVNDRHELMVSPYKLASGSGLLRRLLRLGRGGRAFHVRVARVRDLALVVRFCHVGSCEPSEESLGSLLAVAEQYQVYDMITLCNNFIKNNITDDSCWNLWTLLNEHCTTHCKDLVKDYILKNIIRASWSSNFHKLNCDQLYDLLTDDKLNVNDEYVLIELIGRWIDHNPHKRANQIGKIIRSVRLGLMTLEQIETLWKNPIIKRTQSNECLTNIRQMRRYLFRNKRNLRPLTKCGNIDIDKERSYQCRPRLPHEAIFVFGGWEAGSASGAVRIFNNRAQQWISYTSDKENNIVLPRPLMSFGVSLFQQTQVFILGGEIHQQQATQEVICYDFLQHKWINKAPMHEVRRDLAVVNLNEESIFAIGGDNNKTVLDSVEKFLPARNQWIEVTPMLMMRSAAAAEALNGKIYVLGGYTESQMEALTASCEVYDPSSNQWTFIKAMSQQRYYFNALTYEDHLYVIGGGDESQWSTVERYSPSNDLWSPMPSLLQQRADFTTCILEGDFYCLGGGGDSFCTAEVERWRPDDMEHGWRRCMKLPAATWGHRCVCVRGVNIISTYLTSNNTYDLSATSPTTNESLDLEDDSDEWLIDWLSTSNEEVVENEDHVQVDME